MGHLIRFFFFLQKTSLSLVVMYQNLQMCCELEKPNLCKCEFIHKGNNHGQIAWRARNHRNKYSIWAGEKICAIWQGNARTGWLISHTQPTDRPWYPLSPPLLSLTLVIPGEKRKRSSVLHSPKPSCYCAPNDTTCSALVICMAFPYKRAARPGASHVIKRSGKINSAPRQRDWTTHHPSTKPPSLFLLLFQHLNNPQRVGAVNTDAPDKVIPALGRDIQSERERERWRTQKKQFYWVFRGLRKKTDPDVKYWENARRTEFSISRLV